MFEAAADQRDVCARFGKRASDPSRNPSAATCDKGDAPLQNSVSEDWVH
jgi:hypothetical protein